MVVDSDEGAGEGENLTKSDEDGVVDFSKWMCNKPTREQCTPEGAHCSSDDELQAFHDNQQLLAVQDFVFADVEDKRIESLELGLLSVCCLV